jgi:NADH-quinone oxidoreductase subunit E
MPLSDGVRDNISRSTLTTDHYTQVDRILKRYDNPRSSIIAILQDIQSKYNYIPREALVRISESLCLPFSTLYGTASFFRAFSLEPRGKHLVTVCLGTACHVRGGLQIVEEIGRLLGIKPGETTEDKEFTLETVNCLGCCALGPVVVIDDKYISKVTVSKVGEILGVAAAAT